jgi:hypothetical protein
MKLKYFIIVWIGFVSCNIQKKSLSVYKYLDRKGFYAESIKGKIIQINDYDDRLNLVLKREYSRVGCNVVDSTIYQYDSRNHLIEKSHFTPTEILKDCKSLFSLRNHIKYVYDAKGKLFTKKALIGIDLEETSDSLIRKNKISYIGVVDSLQLLNDYVKDINFILSHVEVRDLVKKTSGSVTVHSYRINDVPSILMDYGIPDEEPLMAGSVYVENNKLIKDEFRFKRYFLTRIYTYKNNIIQNVSIENIQINNKNKAISKEYFVFK